MSGGDSVPVYERKAKRKLGFCRFRPPESPPVKPEFTAGLLLAAKIQPLKGFKHPAISTDDWFSHL